MSPTSKPVVVEITECTIQMSRRTGHPFLMIEMRELVTGQMVRTYGSSQGAVGQILLHLGIVDRDIYGDEGGRPNIYPDLIGARLLVRTAYRTFENRCYFEIAEVIGLAPQPVVINWEHEPDLAVYEFFGLPCIAIRHPHLKHWCGYVGVPRGSKYWGMDYNDVPGDPHGGWTWAKNELPFDQQTPEPHWWLGFDCNHAWDLAPGMIELEASMGLPYPTGREYRTLDYVKAELEKAAQQLAGV